MGSVLGGLFGSGGTTTSTSVRELPGIFGGGREKAGQLGSQIEQLLGSQPGFLEQLRGELTQPSFGPQSASQQAILDSIIDLTQGQTATRGLGPATQGALGQAIAPTIAGFQQQRVGNLAQALGLEQAGRGQQLGGLLELAGLAAPQPLVTQRQTTKQPGLGTSILGGLAGGVGTGLGQRIAQP